MIERKRSRGRSRSIYELTTPFAPYKRPEPHELLSRQGREALAQSHRPGRLSARSGSSPELVLAGPAHGWQS